MLIQLDINIQLLFRIISYHFQPMQAMSIQHHRYCIHQVDDYRLQPIIIIIHSHDNWHLVVQLIVHRHRLMLLKVIFIIIVRYR
jgi:hypothetical protein